MLSGVKLSLFGLRMLVGLSDCLSVMSMLCVGLSVLVTKWVRFRLMLWWCDRLDLLVSAARCLVFYSVM